MMMSWNALKAFNTYKDAIDPELKLTVDRFHFLIKDEIRREWLKVIAPSPLSDQESPLKTFHISVKQEFLDILDADLPASGKQQFVKGYIRISDDRPGKARKIKLRYRGDSNYHWLYEKKSLRIKLSNNDVYQMAKKFNLINPPTVVGLREVINYKLSRKLGIISPDYVPSRVYINGRYMGVYLYVSQVDESLLRKSRLMPGSIYYGDGSPVGDNGIAQLWLDEKHWTKKSSRNSEQKSDRDDIKLFISSIINSSDQEFIEFVETYLDKQKFFTFIALDRVFGSHHHDYNHNHKLYFDPYKGKFEPISWDLRFWLAHEVKDLSLYPLQLRLTSNPIYDSEIDKIAFEIMKDNFLSDVENEYRSIVKVTKRDVESDIYKDTAINIKKLFPRPISKVMRYRDIYRNIDHSMNVLRKRTTYLHQMYDSTSIKYYLSLNERSQRILSIVIDGPSPVEISINNHLSGTLIYNGIALLEKTILYSGRKIIEKSQHLFAESLYGRKTVRVIPSRYNFIIDTSISDDAIINGIRFTNSVNGNEIHPDKADESAYSSNIISGILSAPDLREVVLKGNVVVKDTLVFDRDTSVIIEPGTVFLMKEKTSVYFYGKVTAVGDRDNPIKFVAAIEGRPWGSVAVQGRGASGSVFNYVEFENGSVATRNLIHYTAPFNIHDVDNFEVKNCKIGPNFKGDDAMHVAYATGVIDHCEFVDARSDALDIDISDVAITNNIFYNSGNDGLDIMTSTVRAFNNVFIEAADKGVSVGEWSDVELTKSLFLRNGIGLEVKDKSTVKIKDAVIIDSKDKAINLYNKNKRYYEGGVIDGGSVYLLGNTKVKADKRSSYEIKHIVENILPDIKQWNWHDGVSQSRFKTLVDEVEEKYGK